MVRRAHGCTESRRKSRCRAVPLWNRREERVSSPVGCHSIQLTSLLKAAKEEQFVLSDWPTDCAPKLVLIQHLPCPAAIPILEKTVRIERSIAKKLKQGAVKHVASRLGDHVHVRTRVPTIAGIISRRLDFDLFKRIRMRNGNTCVKTTVSYAPSSHHIDDRDAVYLEVVLPRSGAVHAKIKRTSPERRPVVNVNADACRVS